MLNKQRLGNEIKKKRKNLKLTQLQVAEGICNQSEISRIESGEYFPSVDVLYRLASRLQVPAAYFFEIITHVEIKRTEIIKEKVKGLSLSKNYNEIFKYCDSLLKSHELFHPEIEKFLLWQMNLSSYYLKKVNFQYCLIELKLLLKNKIEGTDTLLDLHIQNSIANIYAENKKFLKSQKLYILILNTSTQSIEGDKLKIKVSYNLGKLLYLQNSFSLALEHTNSGIDLSKKNHDMSILGQLFYQKGALMEKIECPYSEIAYVYKQAKVFFELLELDLHIKILKKYKESYL